LAVPLSTAEPAAQKATERVSTPREVRRFGWATMAAISDARSVRKKIVSAGVSKVCAVSEETQTISGKER